MLHVLFRKGRVAQDKADPLRPFWQEFSSIKAELVIHNNG